MPTNDGLQNSDLIKFGPHDQILIGHNVAFDRSKVAEEYQTRSKKIFLDTMSFHEGPDSFCCFFLQLETKFLKFRNNTNRGPIYEISE